jgi:hypothetical protein
VTAGGYAWLATDLRPFTLPLLVAVLMGGLAAVALGANLLPARVPREPGRPRRLPVWAGLGGALALWELVSFLQHPRSEHPTLSSFTNAWFQSHPTRALGLLIWLGAGARLPMATLRWSRTGRLSLLATWLWLGWHLFVRANYS